MRILVTGASGFIGRSFCRQALQSGHQIVALSRHPRANLKEFKNEARFSAIPFDFLNPYWSAIPSQPIDACLHAAWIAEPGCYWDSQINYQFLELSKTFFHKVFETCRQPHFCITGTCAEYEATGKSLRETDSVKSQAAYTECKISLSKYLNDQQFPHSWARIFYPYGPLEHSKKLASSAIASFRQNYTIKLNTPQSIKDYIFIDDVVSALLFVIERKFKGRINIGTGTAVTVYDLVDHIQTIMDKCDLIRITKKRKKDPLDYMVADISELNAIGWHPEISLETSLKDLLSWWREKA